MSTVLTAIEIRTVASLLEGWELPADFQMPAIEEIEHDLTLSEPSWVGLLKAPNDAADCCAADLL